MAGLEGVIVVDLTQYAAGPAASRLLGELGATVIKVEPFTGDEQRTQGAAWGMHYKSEFDDVAYDCGSFNKEWTAIDCKSPEGKEAMMRLLEKADIFVTSLRDGALQRLGFDYETLHAKFPKLVWAQNRGYGQFGPMKDAKASTQLRLPHVLASLLRSRRTTSTMSPVTRRSHLATGTLAALFALASWVLMQAHCARAKATRSPRASITLAPGA